MLIKNFSDNLIRVTEKKFYFIIVNTILFTAISFNTKAQNLDGYVVLNSGDTIDGQIKQRSALFTHLMHELVVLYDNSGEKIKIEKDELKSYKINSDEYFIIPTVRKKDTIELLAKRVIDGPCQLFEYWYVRNAGPYGTTSPQRSYYLKKEGKPAHPYKYRDLLKGRDHYFADMPQLNFDIQQKKYHRSEIEKIVNRYNQEYNN